MKPTIGRIVWYRTDGRNGLSYDLPAIINCTKDTHPGDYPGGEQNPLPIPESDQHVHLTVFSPGGFGTRVMNIEDGEPDSADFLGAKDMVPGSGSYVEWNVPMADDNPGPQSNSRTWRWPERNES